MLPLALAYPVLVHLAVMWPHAWLEWLALAVLSALLLHPWLSAKRAWAWCALAAALIASVLVVRFDGSHWVLLLPPVAIPLSLLYMFGASLRSGHTPMVTRYAALLRGELPPDLVRYTRSVTVLWTVVFVVLTLSAVLLALFATRELWSLATNFLHYLVIGGVFIAEYAFRRWRFRHHAHPSLRAYLRLVRPARLRTP